MQTFIQIAGIGKIEKLSKEDPLLDIATATFDLPADSAVFDGHFPGQPVVPGIVLLDWVSSVLGNSIETFSDVRFMVPVTPGEARTIEVTRGEAEDRKFTFLIRVDGEFAARGRGTWAE